MQHVTKLIFGLILTIQTPDLIGCSCGSIPSVDEYDYIALVEVTGVLKSDLYELGKSDEPQMPIFHEIKVKTIEQFKGKKQDFLIIQGGNHKYNVGLTSCDLNMEIGEKWIIYGQRFKRKISAGFCSLSILHMNQHYQTDFKHNRSTNRLKNLKRKFKSYCDNDDNDKIELNYLNGKPKLREEYNTKSNLTGKRQAFYRNGQLMVDENYKVGLKNGSLTWYHKNGQTHRISTFNKGKEICETYFYDYRGNLMRINFYDDEGNFVTSQKNAR